MSCSDDFLKATITDDVESLDQIFADSTLGERFLATIYNGVGFDVNIMRFDDAGGLQAACDEAEYFRGPGIITDAQFATGTVNAISVSDDAWKVCYTRIRRANIFLRETANREPIWQDFRLRNYQGEVLFLRAWYYHILLRHYGGVPIIGDDTYNADDVMKTKRNTFEECVDYITQECTKASEMLTTVAPSSNTEYGHAGRGACAALIARVRLYAASPLFNGSEFGKDQNICPKNLVGYEEYDHERWRLAKEAAKTVIDIPAAYFGEPYGLFGSIEDENNNDEINAIEPGWGWYAQFVHGDYTSNDRKPFRGTIFENANKRGQNKSDAWWPRGFGGSGRGGTPYADLVDAFPMIDGTPINKNDPEYLKDPFKNRDPRLLNTIIVDGSRIAYQNEVGSRRPVNIALNADGTNNSEDNVYTGTQTGFYFRKMAHRDQRRNSIHNHSDSYPLIRIAEIMLAYAEAVNEYDIADGALASEESYKQLQLIRQRAGILPGDNENYGLKVGMTKEEMRKAIQDEKRIEFAAEGHRFWDVRRWMIAEQTDNKVMQGMETRKGVKDSNTRTYKYFDMNWQHVFRKAMYLWPIPYNEIAKSSDLIQNPYY